MNVDDAAQNNFPMKRLPLGIKNCFKLHRKIEQMTNDRHNCFVFDTHLQNNTIT